MSRCRHSWKIVARRFEPPVPLKRLAVTSEDDGGRLLAQQMLYGFTRLSLVCEHCGWPSTEELVGEWADDREDVSA